MSFETALLMQKKCNYRRAIQLYQEVVQIDPCHCRAQGGLALSLAALQEYERAKCAAVQALALNKNCDYAHLALALICHAQHEKEQFVDEVERAFYVKPFVFDIASKYAQFLADEKEVTSALPVFERMIEADEARECRHYLYALALYQLRKPKLAVQQSLVALRRDPSFQTFCLLIRAVFGLMPFVSFPITLFFLASLVWLVPLGVGLPWYLGTLFILTYIFTWILIGTLAFSMPALSGQKKKRSLLLLTITVVNISLFLAILASLLF